MNKTVSESIDLANGLVRELKDIKEVDIAICPPFTALSEVSKSIIDSNIRLGAQNMSQNNYGAHTGEIAAGMLKEFSTKYVILGHSERREYQRESNELIAAKSKTAHEAGLKPIVCVGEQLEERESGKTEDIVQTQIRGLDRRANARHCHRLRASLGYWHRKNSYCGPSTGSSCFHSKFIIGNF